MRYAIYGNLEDQAIRNKLNVFELDEINPDVVFSFGGDGTMLGSIKKYHHLQDKVKFIGINTGRLGFYTDFVIDEIDLIIDLLNKEDYETTNFTLLDYEIITDQNTISGHALNEVAITNPIHTQIIDVYLNDKLFETFRGTGFLISTPSGSTAYNKSLGGSIIEPIVKAMQLTEIASINNRVYKTISSPLVLSKNIKVSLKSDNYHNIFVCIDGEHIDIKNINEITGKISDQEVTFIIKKNTTFFDRIKRSFLE